MSRGHHFSRGSHSSRTAPGGSPAAGSAWHQILANMGTGIELPDAYSERPLNSNTAPAAALSTKPSDRCCSMQVSCAGPALQLLPFDTSDVKALRLASSRNRSKERGRTLPCRRSSPVQPDPLISGHGVSRGSLGEGSLVLARTP
jgi:hypothetical protein